MAVRLVCVLAAALCCALAAAVSSAPVGGAARVLEEQGDNDAGGVAGRLAVTWESLTKMVKETEGNAKAARSMFASAQREYQLCRQEFYSLKSDKKTAVTEACANGYSAIEKARPDVQAVQQFYNTYKKRFKECEERKCFNALDREKRETWRYLFQSSLTTSASAKRLAEAASTAAAAAKKAVEDAQKSNNADEGVNGSPSAGHGAAQPEKPPPSTSGGAVPSTQPPEVNGSGNAGDEAATAAVDQARGAHGAQGKAASTPVSSSGKATSGTSERAGGSITGGDKHTGKAGGVTGTTAAPMWPPPMSLSALFHDVDGGVVPGGARELLLVAAALAFALV